MTTIRKVISRNLRVLRAVRGMSQDELSAVAGIDRSYISEIENDKYSPSADKIETLAMALGVAPWELLHPQTAAKAQQEADRTNT
jgi:transcriptional regulator with XRE-family HTH domain